MTDSLNTLQKLAQGLYDKKGLNIIAIDVRNISTMTDFFLFVDGMASTHLLALRNVVEETLREIGWSSPRVDGQKGDNWVVLDCLNIVVHLFDPKTRDFYRVEEVWKDGKIVPLELT
ncbi:MAG: ribosome silencing factor [Chlamydiota bacterium]